MGWYGRASSDGTSVAQLYHYVSANRAKQTPVEYFAVQAAREGANFRFRDPETRPRPFKVYPGADVIELPDYTRTQTSADEPIGVVLSRLLHLTAGVTRRVDLPDAHAFFRASMSAGNLHPLELYVSTRGAGGIPPGTYHYDPLHHALDVVNPHDRSDDIATACGSDAPGQAAASINLILAGVPAVATWKYAERGWRHMYWDAGAVIANLEAVLSELGLSYLCHTVFVDELVAAAVDIDSRTEYPLAIVEVNVSNPAPHRATSLPTGNEVAAVGRGGGPVLPLVDSIQRAGDLASPTSVRAAMAALGSIAPHRAPTYRKHGSGSASIDDVILQRGATRAMLRQPAHMRLLERSLAVAAAPFQGDLGRASPEMMHHRAVVHAIDGLSPGVYRHDGARPVLEQPGDFRKVSKYLCVNQRLAEDSAFCVFHLADLEHLLDTQGPRAYRIGNLSAGISAGRIALQCVRLGYGSSALTFFDEEVRRFFNSPLSCLLVSCVGVPAYQSRRGGRPREPTTIRLPGPANHGTATALG